MKTTNFSLMSGKYEVIRTLGSGSFSTVYLARHQSLEAERAVKVIPKACSEFSSVLSEARLLQSMNHPGIPKIFDIEEDSDFYYLVEEYITGESLEELLLHQPFISLSFFYTCCMQLCEIFIYLHSFYGQPVLYQDLKPAHIIVCGNQIKLIDFGVAGAITSLGNNFKQFGNVEFSAPEHLLGQSGTIAADVYSVGKFMDYLKNFLDVRLSKSFQHIIQKATEPDAALRYETVEAMYQAIEKQSVKISQPHLCKKIAVAGSFPGCGATFLSYSIVSALNFMGAKTVYYEENPDNSLRKTAAVIADMWERDGCFRYRFFCGYPKYGSAVRIETEPDGIRLLDFGTNLTAATESDADLILYVCSGAPWHFKDSCAHRELLLAEPERIKIVCNLGDARAARLLAREFSLPVYLFSYEKAPFSITREKLSFAKQLLKQKGRVLPFFTLRKK